MPSSLLLPRAQSRTQESVYKTFLIWSGLAPLLIAPVVFAAPAPPYAVLVLQAESAAPRLAESGANVRVAEGNAEQADVAPNPVLGFEVENLGYRDRNGMSQRQSTLSINQTLELGGKQSARAAAGRADVDAALARRSLSQTDFGYDLAVAYATAEAAQSRVQLLEEDLGRAREDMRAARMLVEAGKEADLRSLQARAAATGAEADFEAARADAAEALARLSSLSGASEPYTSITVSLLERAESLKPPPMRPPAMGPAVIAAEAQRKAASQRIGVERARAIPDVTLSVGARQFEGQNGTAIVAGVSVPLPLFDRNRGAVSAANAQLAAAEANLNGERLDAEANWAAAAAQAAAGNMRLKAAAEGTEAAREAYRRALVGYQAGKMPLFELLNTRRVLTEAQTRQLDARLARIRAEAVLARLDGRIPFGDNR